MSLLDHGFIRTAAVERTVAPIAGHLCHLVLLCDQVEEPDQFSQLEEAAWDVAKATEHMAAVASRHISDTEDEILHMEMFSLLESFSVSGQHVLLAAQKLSIQPGLTEHREELITATQSVFLGVVKILLLDDDATVRKVIAAAEHVLESVSELGSSPDIKSLLKSFQVFSKALLHLNKLTVDRADALQDPSETKQLLDCLETLRRCISMLHTAMCTTIKHPTSQQAQEAKRYILEKVRSTIEDIITILKSERNKISLGACGFYTEKRSSLLQLLSSSTASLIQNSDLDCMVRDVVFHCMVVANSSRREFQQRVVINCRLILQHWSDIKLILKSSNDPEQNLKTKCNAMTQQIQMLDQILFTTVLYEVLDTFLQAFLTFDKLSDMTKSLLAGDSATNVDMTSIHPVVEDLISLTDRVIQVANFVSAVAVDAKRLENVENSRACLTRLRSRFAPLSLELADNSVETIQKLHDMCQKWDEEIGQLHDALSDVMDVREFTTIAVNEMVKDRQGCDLAYREQNYNLFAEHTKHLICHMKLVVHSVKRHLDKSDNPIYRNGLLVLLKQVESSQTKVAESVRDMLLGSSLNVKKYSAFSENVSTVIQHFKVLREGLDGHQHPHLLSPLREGARRPEVLQLSSQRKDTCEINMDHVQKDTGSFAFEVVERGSDTKHQEELPNVRSVEVAESRKYDNIDLKMPAVTDEPELIQKPLDFNLLPLLYEVVTVTKGKDVSVLNQACTRVLELSNCYAKAAKEALFIVDATDCQTLESLRAELVSLTPLLVKTAQETAMSSAMSTENIYKYSIQFSDLISNIRKLLLPVAGTWYHTVYAELQGSLPTMLGSVTQNLNQVITICADVVQLLTSSDVKLERESQETFSVLHSKLSKAQINTRCLVDFSGSSERQVDHLGGLCMLWGLSIQILLNSLDKILATWSSTNQLNPKKHLSVLFENSLRLQEATRLTSLNCKSKYKSKQLTSYQDELKTLTETHVKAFEDLNTIQSVAQLAKSEILQRHVLIKIKELSGRLGKENKDYISAFENILKIAYSAAEHSGHDSSEDIGQKFENAAQELDENIQTATRKVEDCLNFIRDARSRSNLRSINDHLSFQISDIICRARLIVESHHICDTLSLDVHIQCWSAKARYLVEEIIKQDAINDEAKELIVTGLQGKTPKDSEKLWDTTLSRVKVDFPDTSPSIQRGNTEALDATGIGGNTEILIKLEPDVLKKDDTATAGVYHEPSSLTYTSLFLKQKSNSWDPKDNRIVQVTRKMADIICHMTQYLKKKGPLLNKEAFVTAAKDVISNCESVTQFIRVIANHSLDKQCTVELSLIIEQILTITNQLSIISSVNAVTPGCKSSNEILVKNAQNLLQTVLRGVHAAETACITGLKQPEPNSDGAEATSLCFQWKRNLEIHRALQTSNPETDELGLRKTALNSTAPSLAPHVNVQNGFK